MTEHTREAGVRGLERELGKAARKIATKVASDPADPAAPVLEGARRLGLDGATLFNHASTMGLNAVITRTLPKVAFLTTEGHRDILDRGRIWRPPTRQSDTSWRRPFGDAARPSGLWEEVGPARAQAKGLEPEDLQEHYRQRNLLQARITPEHVGNAVVFFASDLTPTTGATLPVDGGIPEAFPR